jgi:nucleoside-triphosphatase
VDLAAFERVALAALRTPRTGGVVVIDELGKMELASAPFRDEVTELLRRDVAVVATVQLARHRFTDALKRRPEVQVIKVTEGTRDALPQQLMEWLVGGRTGELR